MLNLSRQEDMLTQGQSPADRVLASPNAQGSPPGDQPGGLPAPGGSPAAGAPDVQLIANRVYELMRQDLLILRERSGYSIGR
jgi:hypothetical protein